MTSVEIPEGVVSIENYAFKNCIKLSSIELPASVETIGNEAFRYCEDLEVINLNEGFSDMNFRVRRLVL